ncbi:hypothetical protein [Flavobacterium reichenbachii]|uniref:Uncharacterized protein n=1 Tax=Flavobacterium reichenbachii TaxID=362418 RepID=A0A085ZNQ6_9FLAO|nr:hypothetical protein [Flavobacterium reichenbachii]KFF06070.1 hypothetical protein IW19_11275 [Flavobacterium reichenbachii]OXB14705.1 hypothetical protein B0A68_11670 [Flavobacterium reichenbachii]
MSNDKFFSKSNIYPTVWAIIVGLIAFISGLIWKEISGPDEVLVLNKGISKDTTVTIIQFKPDQEYFDNLTKMTSKSIQKQYSTNQTSEKKKTIDSLTLAIAKDYQLKFDSFRLNTKGISTPFLNDKIVSIPSTETETNTSRIQRPLLKLPSIVEGYIDDKPNSFATISINSKEFTRKDNLTINVNFFSKSTLEKITPLFIDIVEPKTANSVYQIWSEQYAINNVKNIITFSTDFKPGKYVLTVGFYIKDDLNKKYPTRYSRKYNIEIK